MLDPVFQYPLQNSVFSHSKVTVIYFFPLSLKLRILEFINYNNKLAILLISIFLILHKHTKHTQVYVNLSKYVSAYISIYIFTNIPRMLDMCVCANVYMCMGLCI
jgi:hypothetical protein